MLSFYKFITIFLVLVIVIGCGGGASDSESSDEMIVQDTDSDGVIDSNDNCPYDSNTNQDDLDSDGIGDVCDDVTLLAISKPHELDSAIFGEISISGDGNLIALAYGESVNGEFQSADIYPYNIESDSYTLVSKNESGNRANGISNNPSISHDGRFVFYESTSSEIAGGELGVRKLIRYDISQNSNTLLTVREPNQNQVQYLAKASLTGMYACISEPLRDQDELITDLAIFEVETNSIVKYFGYGQCSEFYKSDYHILYAGSLSVALQTYTSDIYSYDIANDLHTKINHDESMESNWDAHYYQAPSASLDGSYVVYQVAEKESSGSIGDSRLYYYEEDSGSYVAAINSSGEIIETPSNIQPKISLDGKILTFKARGARVVAGYSDQEVVGFIYDIPTGEILDLNPSGSGDVGFIDLDDEGVTIAFTQEGQLYLRIL